MGDTHSVTDFHFLFLDPPALTNFTDDQRPLAERHVGRPLERTRKPRFEVDAASFFEVGDQKPGILSDLQDARLPVYTDSLRLYDHACHALNPTAKMWRRLMRIHFK